MSLRILGGGLDAAPVGERGRGTWFSGLGCMYSVLRNVASSGLCACCSREYGVHGPPRWRRRRASWGVGSILEARTGTGTGTGTWQLRLKRPGGTTELSGRPRMATDGHGWPLNRGRRRNAIRGFGGWRLALLRTDAGGRAGLGCGMRASASEQETREGKGGGGGGGGQRRGGRDGHARSSLGWVAGCNRPAGYGDDGGGMAATSNRRPVNQGREAAAAAAGRRALGSRGRDEPTGWGVV